MDGGIYSCFAMEKANGRPGSTNRPKVIAKGRPKKQAGAMSKDDRPQFEISGEEMANLHLTEGQKLMKEVRALERAILRVDAVGVWYCAAVVIDWGKA